MENVSHGEGHNGHKSQRDSNARTWSEGEIYSTHFFFFPCPPPLPVAVRDINKNRFGFKYM